MLFLVFVLDGIRRGVAPQPELLDELLTLFVGLQHLESVSLFVGDDVLDVFGEPLTVGRLKFLASPFLILLLLFGKGFRDGLLLWLLHRVLLSRKDSAEPHSRHEQRRRISNAHMARRSLG